MGLFLVTFLYMVDGVEEVVDEKRKETKRKKRTHCWVDESLLLGGLLGSLGGLAALALGLLHALDDSDGDGLLHVAHGEAAKRRVLLEGLDVDGLLREHLDDGGVTRLEGPRVLLQDDPSSPVNLLKELGELAGDVGGVAVDDGGVSSVDLAGWLRTTTWAVKETASLAGLFLASDTT